MSEAPSYCPQVMLHHEYICTCWLNIIFKYSSYPSTTNIHFPTEGDLIVRIISTPQETRSQGHPERFWTRHPVPPVTSSWAGEWRCLGCSHLSLLRFRWTSQGPLACQWSTWLWRDENRKPVNIDMEDLNLNQCLEDWTAYHEILIFDQKTGNRRNVWISEVAVEAIG